MSSIYFAGGAYSVILKTSNWSSIGTSLVLIHAKRYIALINLQSLAGCQPSSDLPNTSYLSKDRKLPASLSGLPQRSRQSRDHIRQPVERGSNWCHHRSTFHLGFLAADAYKPTSTMSTAS